MTSTTVILAFVFTILWWCFALAVSRVSRTMIAFSQSQDEDLLVGYTHTVWFYAALGPLGLLILAYDLDAMLELYIKPKQRLHRHCGHRDTF